MDGTRQRGLLVVITTGGAARHDGINPGGRDGLPFGPAAGADATAPPAPT